MAENGVPLQVAKEYLGHADIQTTAKYYTHISKDSLYEAVVKANRDRHNSRQEQYKIAGEK